MRLHKRIFRPPLGTNEGVRTNESPTRYVQHNRVADGVASLLMPSPLSIMVELFPDVAGLWEEAT